MKKHNNFISLMYKEIDNTISKDEKIKLDEHLLKCKKCQEEYKIIKFVSTGLKNEKEVPLPCNFNSTLHKKLVEETLKEKKQSIFKKMPINIFATVCAAIALTVFAFNIDAPDENNNYPQITIKDNTVVNDNTVLDSDKAENEVKENIKRDKNIKKTVQKPIDNNIGNNIPNKNIDKNETENINKSRTITKSETENELPDDTKLQENYSLDNNKREKSIVSSGNPLLKNEKKYTIILPHNFDITLLSFGTKISDNTYSFSKEDLSKVKEIISDTDYKIENENVLNNNFIVVIEEE